MPLPALVLNQLSGVGLGIVTELLAGIFGGLFGGDPKPDLPGNLCWAYAPVLSNSIYSRLKNSYGGIPLYENIPVVGAICLTGDAIEERSSGIVVATWHKDHGIQEIIGYTLDGIPIHGNHPENITFSGELAPHVQISSVESLAPWQFVIDKLGKSRQPISILPLMQSKAQSYATKIYGGFPPISPPRGGTGSSTIFGRGGSSSTTRGGVPIGGGGSSIGGRSTSGTRGGTPSRSLGASSPVSSGGFNPLILLVGVGIFLIWRSRR